LGQSPKVHVDEEGRDIFAPVVRVDRMTSNIRENLSPNHDERPATGRVDTLILHYTGMQSAQAAIDRLCDPVARVSSHYVVDEDGAVFRLVPEERRAWHAGISYWRGHNALNDRSIGIEIVNPGHEWGYRDFPALQMAAVCDLCLSILSRQPIPPRNVIGHSDVAPDRKTDPGEKFRWEDLARNGVGLWPVGAPNRGIAGTIRDAVGLRPVRAALARIGYLAAPEGALDPALSTVLRAFQRHWRQEAVNGQADDGTVARLEAVLELAEAN
jgi:N-acetylmuramoyl-L-alanine amidase